MVLLASPGCPCKRLETLRPVVIDRNLAQQRLDSRLDATKAALAALLLVTLSASCAFGALDKNL